METPAVNPKHFTELCSPTNKKGKVVAWLFIRQTKYKMRNVLFMRHNPTSETQQDQKRHGHVRRSVRRVFEFYVQDTLVRRQDVLAIDLSNTRRRIHSFRCYLLVASQICF